MRKQERSEEFLKAGTGMGVAVVLGFLTFAVIVEWGIPTKDNFLAALTATLITATASRIAAKVGF